MKTCIVSVIAACFVAHLVAAPEQPLQPTAKTEVVPQHLQATVVATQSSNLMKSRANGSLIAA